MKKIMPWYGRIYSAWRRILPKACLLLLALSAWTANADVYLTPDVERVDLHRLDGGTWHPDWVNEPSSEPRLPGAGVPNAGFSADIYHWHATLHNTSAETRWLLVIRNPSLDIVRVSLDGQDAVQTGDYQTPRARPWFSHHLALPLTLGQQSSALSITATSDDWQFYPMMLVTESGYQRYVQQEMLAVGTVTGLLLAVFLFNLVQTLLKGHWSFVWTAATALLWSLHIWFWYGLGALWLWPNQPWWQQHVWYITLIATALGILASMISAVGERWPRAVRPWLNTGLLGGVGALTLLLLLAPKGLFLSILWVWFAGMVVALILCSRRLPRMRTLHTMLGGYALLSGLFFAYMAFSPYLINSHMLTLFLFFSVITGFHSFAVYWQYHTREQQVWHDLQVRSQRYEDEVDEGREQLARYRSALQSGRSWRYAFTRNLAQRFATIEQSMGQLRQSVLAEERQELLNLAVQASHEGQRYIQDLGQLEQVLVDDYAPVLTHQRLTDWLAQFNDWVEEQDVSARVFFRAEALGPAADLPTLQLPGEALTIICQRLLDNAFQHTSSGFVKLVVEQEASTMHSVRCAFEVRDSGSGMNDALLGAVQAFWNQTANADQQHLLGSGLTIALTLLRRLDASLRVQAAENAGTSVRFSLDLNASTNQDDT
ncbi:ATP-binding protein [Salinispirillum marinum]|uniref:histidine kinase n=2 Tax=Saccharospirillaceae TaxID=255527 RepID=A0ABV8BC90_9GAMM